MPFIGSFSGSKLVSGSGAYHPGVVTLDTASSPAVNSVVSTSSVSAPTSPNTYSSGLTVTAGSGQARVAFDPFQNGTITYSIVGANVASGTISQIQSNNVYISFSAGGFGNLYLGQPFRIDGKGSAQGGLAAGTTYYILTINSGSGYVTLASSYANYQSNTVTTFATTSAGNGSGYSWTDTNPTWSAGGGLPSGYSMNSAGSISGGYTFSANNTNYDINAAGLYGGGNNTKSNLYAIQVATTSANGFAGPTEIFNIQVTVPYQFRQILTTCYIFGGYKSSVPFANVNKCVGSNDTNINTGNNLTHSQAYNMGPWGWNYAYCMGMSDAYSGDSTVVCAWNMRTETARTTNFTATWVDSLHNQAVVQQEYYYSWQTSGGTIREFNLSTETYNGTPSNQVGSGGNASSASHEVRGIFNGSNASWDYATRTGSIRSAGSMSGSVQSKIIQNKNPTTNVWGNNNAGANSQKMVATNFPSDTTTTTSVNVPNNGVASSEENHTNVQDWGYCIGWYDGVHVPNTYKWVFATQSGTYNPNGMQYQGQTGNSSGWGANRD